jgi:type VI secretion system protein ImpG
MDQRLLNHYNNELRFIREMGSEFASHFPKVAGRLGMEGLECADPYVERLLEGFAFLAARVQLKIEDEFPSFCKHLLEIVYPDYLAPLPSMAVVQLHPETDDPGLADGFVLERHTSLRSGLGAKMQTACEYRTAQEVTLLPMKVSDADYMATRASLAKLGIRPGRTVSAGLRITIDATAGVGVNELNLSELPLYLGGSGTIPLALYEQMLSGVCGLSLIATQNGERKVFDLDVEQLQPLGFAADESCLPYRTKSFEGYRLLREYFAFPERFRFICFSGLDRVLPSCEGHRFELVVHLKQRDADLENVVDDGNFLPFCTPVINLFPKRTDRVLLNKKDHEFHVVVDRSRPMDYEIHQVLGVTGYGSRANEEQVFLPFYALRDRHLAGGDSAFYTLQRKPRLLSSKQKLKGARSSYLGQEVFISLVDGQEAPYSSDLRQLGLDTMCTNRDLPMQMPMGQRESDFTLETNSPVRMVRVIAGPTRPSSLGLEGETRTRSLGSSTGDLAWRLIGHLSLNFLSLVDESPEEGAAALRELLELYSAGHTVGDRQVNALVSVNARPVTRRLPIPGPISFGRGLEITLVLDEGGFEAGGMYLFGSVIREFFRKYVSLNNMIETVVKSDSGEEVARWPVMMGRRPTL